MLYICCKYGHFDCVKYLITECNADPNIHGTYTQETPGKYGGTRCQYFTYLPLEIAAEKGHLNIVKLLWPVTLLKEYYNIERLYDRRPTPLHTAVKNNHTSVVDFIIQQDIANPWVNFYGKSFTVSLYEAINNNNRIIVNYLLKNGADADIDCSDIFPQYVSPLKYCLSLKTKDKSIDMTEIIYSLFDNGADYETLLTSKTGRRVGHLKKNGQMLLKAYVRKYQESSFSQNIKG